MTMENGLLEKFGEYYCSRYVALNQPWILEIPFHQWVERQVSVKFQRLLGERPGTDEWLMQLEPPAGSAFLPETA